MPTSIMKALRVKEDQLNLEQENSNGDYMKMKPVFEKRIQLYNRYLNENDLTELERLTLSNRKEWQMSHLLGLIEREDMTNKLSDLTRRIHRLEEAIQVEEE
jgi:hypothetical protein